MKIFKFGGASVKDAQSIRNVVEIIRKHAPEPALVVISALGKTTNRLEALASAFFENRADTQALFEAVRDDHRAILKELIPEDYAAYAEPTEALFSRLERYLQQEPSDNFDFEYDQIVSFGELFSTRMVSAYLEKVHFPHEWMDARRLVRTDNHYREGEVDWVKTERNIQKHLQERYPNGLDRLLLTQGFIAGTPEKFSITLGREGSDYSAAIFAHALQAESVTIWKDVDGLLNADPKVFPNAVKLEQIPYREAIELAYYGASVIHPKTIKPLQNKNIPLYVKSFLHPEESGSVIHSFKEYRILPCYIRKTNQVLLSIFSKDFSFIAEENLSTIFALFALFNVKINVMQNSAISFSVCVDAKDTLPQLIEELQTEFVVRYNENVELLSIRHYAADSLAPYVKGRKVMMEQRSRSMLQVVLK
ncbi:MAG: aspartate kinase [Bacteroidales bacterium]|nr:aspartate kinase [Bacteroidales bacterium]